MNLNFADGSVRLMGILNVTPDSFSDGGEYLSADKALSHARRMKAEGADIIDIGAESTRPGHLSVSAADEIERLKPVMRQVAKMEVPVSVDTTKAEVAAFALGEGASMINDVWGLQKDASMARLAAAKNIFVVVMHNRETADAAIDIMADMQVFFARSFEIAKSAGLPREKIILDPGIGFGKTFEQNLIVLKSLSQLKTYGLPILVGASRKSFIGKISESMSQQRLPGSLAAHLAAVENGASLLRIHDVAEMKQALDVSEAIRNA